MEYPKRANAATAAILLMSVFAVCTLASFFSLVSGGPGPTAGVVMDENRFAQVRAILPSRGTIGYLSDTDASSVRDYYLTQYFLAPLVVAPDSAHGLVIANFTSHSPMAPAAAANGFIIERDFSNGLGLLRRQP